ncbi:hypothetical protein HDU98_002277 [Podochytrium sp. JEL0797]|nr:hypothetical protein HDU98_002277 [Podochytrium sp. JEL0797]
MVKRAWTDEDSTSDYATATLPMQCSPLHPGKRFMASFGFSDRIAFPLYESLPVSHLRQPNIYCHQILCRAEEGTSYMRPVRHWCFLAEIADVSFSFRHGRPSVAVRIGDGSVRVVEFNAAQIPLTFQWTDLRKGSCIAILYAQHSQLNRDLEGVFVNDLDSCFVFHTSLSILNYYATTLALRADVGNSAGLSPQALVIQWLLEAVQRDFSELLSFSWAFEGDRRIMGL